MKPILKILTDIVDQDVHEESMEVALPVINLPSGPVNPLTFPSIRNEDDDRIFQVIVMSLAKAYTDLGQKQPEGKDKTYIANSLADSIPRKFPSIRLHEIPLAFENGIRGKYGAYYGLSVVTFENFIEAHLMSESREQFARSLPVLAEVKEPDSEAKFNTASSNAVKLYEEFKSGKDVSLAALIVYDFLFRLGMIQYTTAEKWDFVKEAEEYLKVSLSKKLSKTLDKNKRADIRLQIKKVDDRTAVDLITNTSKRLALYHYFRGSIVDELDLKQAIEANREKFN